MNCPFCKDPNPAFDKPQSHHIVIGRSNDGHIHVHGDLSNKEIIGEMLNVAEEESGASKLKQMLDRKEIVFHNRQRIGDILMFTCGVRDFKKAFPQVRVNVISTASHIWDHNPNIDRTLKDTPENTIKIGPGKLTNSSNRIDWHFANAYRVSIEDNLKVTIPQGESRPDIYFTQEEYDAPRIRPEPYWIIIVNGEKGWGCKMYPFDRWQEFVNQNPDTLFYQLGTKGDDAPRLQGPNVVDYIGKTEDKDTGIRDLFKLFLNAEGSIGLVSFHMHLSGALSKPCIVVAGAREPVSFTRYAGHQYLATDGCLPCAINACWHCDIDRCTNLIVGKEKVPKCVDMIYPEDLTRALNNYYVGGRLTKGQPSNKPKLKNIVPTPVQVSVPAPVKAPEPINNPNAKLVRVVSTARGWGGCARSVTTIMKLLLNKGHKVEFVPFRNKVTSNEFLQELKNGLKDVKVQESYNVLHEACDTVLVYADDYVWEFDETHISEPFSNINAERKIMMLNYRRGGVGEIDWTRGWDKYMFLNSTQEEDLKKVLPDAKTKVLPPCTILEPFLVIKPDYSLHLRVVRHSSQGDVKFPKEIGNDIKTILDYRKESEIFMLPGPSFVEDGGRFKKMPRTADPHRIAEFLALGSLFWYSLPYGYMDMGPRVVLEAMAAGLPVLADNWGGVTDRVTPECGWLTNLKEEQVEILKNVDNKELQSKGEAAKQRAIDEFIPERWIEELVG